MSQLTDANRIYQRDTTSGGSFGKGAGTIAVTLNVTSPGQIWARTRAADGTTVTQDWFLAVDNAPIANGVVNIPGIEARANSFYLDLSGDKTVIRSGTTLVFMGILWMLFASQSYTANCLANPYKGSPNNDDTLATLGITPAANTYSRTGTLTSWTQFSDPSSTLNSPGGAWLLNKAAQYFGVAVGLIGHAVGGTTVEDWAVGNTTTNYLTTALNSLSAAGGKAEIIQSQLGHSNTITAGGTTYTNQMDDYVAYGTGVATQGYISKLNAIVDAVKAANGFSSPKVLIGTVPGPAGATSQAVELLRREVGDWIATKGYTQIDNSDSYQWTDGSHPRGQGMVYQVESWVRAAAGNLSGQPAFPSTMVRGTPSGGNVDYTLNLTGSPVGITGDIKPVLNLWKRGDRAAANKLTVNSAVLSGNALTVNVVDPGDVPVELLFASFLSNSDSAGRNSRANNIFDADTLGGVLSTGRAPKPSPRSAIYKPASAVLGVGTPSYSASGAGPFGGTSRSLTSGYGITPFNVIPNFYAGFTLFFRLKHLGPPATAGYIMGATLTNFPLQIQLQTNGDLKVSTSASQSLTIPYSAFTMGWNDVKLMFSPMLQIKRYKVNGALVMGDDAVTNFSPQTVMQMAFGGAANTTFTGLSGSNMSGRAELADIGIFTGMRDFTVSSTGYLTGTETGLSYRIPLNGTADILIA